MLTMFDCITYICYGKQCKEMYGLTSSGQPYSVAHNIEHHEWKLMYNWAHGVQWAMVSEKRITTSSGLLHPLLKCQHEEHGKP